MSEMLGEKRAFVHRVNRGFARWFFQVSVPLDYLDPVLKQGSEWNEGIPIKVAQAIAELLDDRLRPRDGQ